MPVKKEASGRRSVTASAEVPGSPEEVWQAIASGPGITAWFVPTEVDGRAGGTTRSNFGPGMDSTAKITEWQPPRRFVAEAEGELGESGGTVATEWTVEAHAGGSCVVRVVHSWFASTDDWDGQFEGHEHGWVSFFRILRLYLAHFRGRRCVPAQVAGTTDAPITDAWRSLVAALGLERVTLGQSVRTASGAPRLAGVVENVGPESFPELLVRVDEPSPGLVSVFAMPMGGRTMVLMRGYFYGDEAERTSPREEGAWKKWLASMGMQVPGA
jgi:uncharacterized protein YndB with AHSA1/START domain